MPEIGTPGSESGGRKRTHGSRTAARRESAGSATDALPATRLLSTLLTRLRRPPERENSPVPGLIRDSLTHHPRRADTTRGPCRHDDWRTRGPSRAMPTPRLRLSAAPLRRNPAASGPTGGRRRAFPATPVRLPVVHLRSLMMMSLTAAAVPEAHRWPSALRPSAAPDHRVPARSAPAGGRWRPRSRRPGGGCRADSGRPWCRSRQAAIGDEAVWWGRGGVDG